MAEETELGVAAMIARLEEQKVALDAAIEALKRLGALGVGLSGLPGMRPPVQGSTGEIEADTFVGMSIADAAQKYLRMVGRPARATEAVVDALLRGGLQRVSPASVVTILIRIHNSDGPIVRVQKGLWGLAEWYPKRPPRATRNEKERGSRKRRGRPPKKKPPVEDRPKRGPGRPKKRVEVEIEPATKP